MIFERAKHVYRSKEFEEIIKNTIRFFNGTPVHKLPSPEKFSGTGVYAIYYIGRSLLYKDFHTINRTSYALPIYIGKAVPKGWRQARQAISEKETYELYSRLREHSHSIQHVNLELSDFKCRFMILENEENSLIGTVEAALIRLYAPLWNTVLDGFGNHDPGKGRYKQAKSNWDVVHKGRSWAEKCTGNHSIEKNAKGNIRSYFAKLKV